MTSPRDQSYSGVGGKNVTTNISERTTHLRVFLLVQLLMNPAFGASSIIFKMKVGAQKDDYVNYGQTL